ncbi:TOBE domain-containing protein [Roseinatronobacter thiooxidans]|uniref:TOBE domain-containing protein n=1 Tax=Roseinatronobacter thiooxidans TaxID=121821 RepID=UPI002011278C|nr:TOBE domain-containing protein [Roseinatronobacter thiooxidans]
MKRVEEPRLHAPEINGRVREAAAMLEIGPFLDRKPRQLAGGQRRRVAMGRALVREPAAFLFDEPLSNLDSKLHVQMRVEIRQLQKRLRTTLLYVTQDQLEALTMADRLVVLNNGQIEQIGTPMEVYSRPATTFVAGFIGFPAMNMLPAEYMRGLVSAESLAHLPIGADLIGIRPEDLSLERACENERSLSGRLVVLEPAGAQSHLHLSFAGIKETMVARLPHMPDVQEGSNLTFSIERDRLHPFDAATGKRVV